MRKFFFKLHLWASLTVSPLLLIFAVTGSLMAFEPELDHLLHAKLYYVKQGDHALSLAQISESVNRSFPKDTINQYYLSTDPGISYQVSTNNRTVYIDQYSGQVLGTATGPDFWNKAQDFIHQLHLRLAFRDKHDTGGVIISWAAVIMLLILPSGLVLWWKQKRITVRKKSKGRQAWFDLHSMIGVLIFLFLLVPALTGVIMGFGKVTTPLMYTITSSKPTMQPDTKIDVPAGVQMISADSAYHIAQNAIPGAKPFDIFAFGAGQAYYIRCRFPEDLTPGGRSTVIVNSYTGQVMYAQGSRTAPAGTRLQILTRAIHTGDVFGIPTKFLGLVVCLALTLQIFSGLKMWWMRKYSKRQKGSASEPA
ncbi:MAG TPA: PepSY-associated TM helix domain-containing protein [Mucilaginibacter sp.]|nr:PepSY-associated TM helix domain-containing protein [Mucilaginibacter sp.]